jgi:hypothetical protein
MRGRRRLGEGSALEKNRQRQKQIPPLRCGMTNRKQTTTAKAKADSFAALRNDKQKTDNNGKGKSRFLRCAAE